MRLNPTLDRLSDYPFPRLTRLLGDVPPPEGVTPVDLSIGEPMHLVPELLARTVAVGTAVFYHGLRRYESGNLLAMRE